MTLDPHLPSSAVPPFPARYIMVGGFLGAGKTTSVLKLARHLHGQGLRVGLITNDQGSQLVDTAMLASHGFPVEEIAGGCFCCRFNSLVDAARKLSGATRPDVFIAEPVGSCTDLVATVSYPLRRIYGDNFSIAPLSVLVDPVRAMRILGLAEGGSFSGKVTYIYLKQLEEADLIVINKCDVLDPGSREALRKALERRFPDAELIEMSARTGAGMEDWFGRIGGHDSAQSTRLAMQVDYDEYAEGEAMLGWLNATVLFAGASDMDGNEVLRDVAREFQQDLDERGAEVAHLKMTLEPEGGIGDLAVINLVRNDFVPELSQELEEPLQQGQLIVNVRAEAAPEVLREALEHALSAVSEKNSGLKLTVQHLEHFQPGRPQPTHRLTSG